MARIDGGDATILETRHGGFLEPPAVVDEALEGNGSVEVIAGKGAKSVQRQSGIGIGEIRCGPGGAKEHARGHGVPPKSHGVAENSDIEVFDPQEMSGCR